jgi:hypothetical protein
MALHGHLSTLRWWAGLATVGAALLPSWDIFLGTLPAGRIRKAWPRGTNAQDIMQTRRRHHYAGRGRTAEVQDHDATPYARPPLPAS